MNHDFSSIVLDLRKKLNICDATVKVCKPPSYLSCFLNDENNNNEIIFVYKEKTIKLDDTAAALKDSICLNGSEEEGDITGQPLEPTIDAMDELKLDEISGDLSVTEIEFEKDTHEPISGYTAMELLSYANMYLKPGIPIWMLVDGTDAKKSVLLGSFRKDDCCTCSWVTVQGKSETDVLDIDSMLNKHHSLTSKRNSKLEFHAEVSCKINVLESKSDSIHGDVYIHANWSTPSIKIPTYGASLSMEFLVKVGEPSSPLYSLWQQLLLLQKYFEMVVKWKRSNLLPQNHATVSLPTSHGIFNNGDVELSLSERIIDALMSPQLWSTDYSNAEYSYQEVLLSIKHGSVPGMDLTGRLWILLSESSTYEELRANTALLFQQAKKCLSTKPFVSVLSKSKMAEAIRILLAEPTTNPPMMVEPLELLVEIGVESLKNNYVAAFVQSKIAKEDLLNVPNFPSFITMNNATWIENVSSYMNWLSKIHSIAEFVSIAQSGIKVTPDISEIIRRMFVFFLGESSPVTSLQELLKNPDLKFLTAITSYPGQNISKPDYEKWSMRLTTNEKYRTITSCFLKTHGLIFPESVLFLDIVPGDKNISTLLSQTDVGLPMISSDKWYFSNFSSLKTKVGK